MLIVPFYPVPSAQTLAFSAACHAHDGENFVASDLFAAMKGADKAALLMVHFGTTHTTTLVPLRLMPLTERPARPSKGALQVGHGTYTPATAQYAMLDYMLKEKGFGNFFVGTIEGYPTFDAAEAQIKAEKHKRVLLMPFMFVAGDHAKNDIAGDWKEALEKRGYQVDVHMEGLGQNPDVQQLFIDHARFISKHKAIDITAKKRAYAVAND